MENTALIMDIKHFAVHDGDGIRTTVFFKGCPLRCRWCHNPEGLYKAPTLSYVAKNCISCGECVTVCKNHAHALQNGVHSYDRTLCIACGDCTVPCLGDALRLYGREMTVDALLPELLADALLYETSGGGVTLSGGECLMQGEFCAELLARLKSEGISTAVDTCGHVPERVIDLVLPVTDVFLYDLKAVREDVHLAATGVSNRLILSNLHHLDESGAAIEVRIPYVPDCNAGEIDAMGRLLSGLSHLTGVRILPFHDLAISKYEAVGLDCHMPKTLPSAEELSQAADVLRGYGVRVLA